MYNLIAIAGTFDRLHKGHRYFISQAFELGHKVLIGLTSDDYVEKKSQIPNPKSQMNSKLKSTNYQIRRKELEGFLQQEGLSDRTEIMKIDDVYGPAIERNDIEALIITSETIKRGRLVNKKRKELGLPLLKLLKLPIVYANDHRRIASTRIRLGEIDRWGRVFKFQIPNAKFQINERLRQELKKPQGILIKGDSYNHQKVILELKRLIDRLQPAMMSTIGDEVTKLCNQVEIPIRLAIFDYKVKRVKIYDSLSDLGFTSLDSTLITIKNPAGYITRTLVDAVGRSIKYIVRDGKTRLIKILGEDDLAGIPAILLSPLGSIVLYGQPGEGIVVVEVTEEKKKKIIELISI